MIIQILNIHNAVGDMIRRLFIVIGTALTLATAGL